MALEIHHVLKVTKKVWALNCHPVKADSVVRFMRKYGTAKSTWMGVTCVKCLENGRPRQLRGALNS